MDDPVLAGLKSLTKADRDANSVIRAAARIPGVGIMEVAPLVPCEFTTRKNHVTKRYRGKVTEEQCALIMDVDGKAPIKVEQRLIFLLRKVRTAVAVLTDALEENLGAVNLAIHPADLSVGKRTAAPPDNLGACNYVNSDGNPTCVDHILQEDCDRLAGPGHFTVKQNCAHQGKK